MKRAARLTSALLAKKGFAFPAATIVQFGETDDGLSDDAASVTASPSMPDTMAEPSIGEAENGVKNLETRLEKAFTGATEKRPAGFGRRRVPAGEKGPRVAMTLRLDADRHLRLRVMSAHSHLSSQQILTRALDEYLKQHCQDKGLQRCECLQGSSGCA